MATSVLHIKTEVECKVFLFDEEKGIATPDKYFNLEVRKGEQDLLFVSILNQSKQFHMTFVVEEMNCDYHFFVLQSIFKDISQESIQNPELQFIMDEPSWEEIENGIEDEHGVVYSKDGSQLLKCCNDVLDNYSVNAGCKVIRNNAFEKCYGLTNVFLPFGLTHIGDYAFGCCDFNSISLPDSIQHIGDWAFYHCENLSTINIPNNANYIGKNPFRYTSVKHCVSNSPRFVIKNNFLIDTVEKRIIAFFSDEKEVVIPDGITHIGDGAFSAFNNISNVVFPSCLTHIGNDAFSWCDGLVSISMPEKLIHIGNSAFYHCESLSAVTLPNGITHIGDEAFCSCVKLSNINFPNSILHIGLEAFCFCYNLTSVILSNSMKNVSEKLFYDCENLETVVFADNVKTIGKKAFQNCKRLSNIILSTGLTHISDDAFFGCENLLNVTFPDGLLSIGYTAFNGCIRLKSINLPSSIINIEEGAFTRTDITDVVCNSSNIIFEKGCLIDVKEKKLIAFLSQNKDVFLPNGITHIGYGAFAGNQNLLHITLPETLTHIGVHAFGCCRKLSHVIFPKGLQQINDGAFEGCESLCIIELNDGLTHLGYNAFGQCDTLNTVFLPASLIHIGNEAFSDCKSLAVIKIPRGMKTYFQSLLPSELHGLLNDEYVCFNDYIEKIVDFKPYYLFFDTETTGVPKDYNAPASNTWNWPRLVQLGWILTDESGNEISSGNEIVKPEGFVIPTDASRVHGITTEVALLQGKPLRQVIQSFLKDTEGIMCFVGHNVSFDQRVVGAELYRLGIADTVSTARSLDTMIAATDYCKIPGAYGYKWPKLIELHRKLFGCDFEDAHDAMADITATKKCFFEMKRRGLI